jgi:Domain of unknown function (DUF5624)/EPTP domain
MPVTLTEIQRIPTSGARAVEPVPVAGHDLLAIPQLARDVPGGPPGMNGGDSDTELLLLHRNGGRFEPWRTLPAPGGEDAEFFTIGDRAFLAVASIRTGAGPYEFETTSTIFEWRDGEFAPFQEVPTFAAKQWKHWQIGGRHFLGLAQGVVFPPGHAGPDPAASRPPAANQDSVVYEWKGEAFVEFQRIPSRWAYNWHAFQAGGEFFVAHAEHAGPSILYRWDGARLQPQQTLADQSGRAFATFDDGGETYLVVACIAAPTRVLRLAGGQFTETQVLDGLGARELAVTRCGGRTLLIRVNFILGTPADPQPSLDSQIYEWDGGKLHEVATFPTCGGTDVTVLSGSGSGSGSGGSDGGPESGTVELIVTNSLTPELRFAADTVRYSLRADSPPTAPPASGITVSGSTASESPELVDLFTTYTASPDSIGAHLAQAAVRAAERDPLLVITGTDVALYPGGGAAPVIEPYRTGSRGFKELAGISHLGPAVATLARLRELADGDGYPDGDGHSDGGHQDGHHQDGPAGGHGQPGGWRADAARLLDATEAARRANSASLWRDQLAVRAFAGREEAIAAMIDYSGRLTERFLRRALDDPAYLSMSAVRRDYLEGPGRDGDLPVPFNKVMIATFYLSGMDIAHRLITWFDAAGIDWERAMVIFAGRVARPTAGVTQESHSIAGVVRAASRGRLPPERVLIAPHAPVFPPYNPADQDTSPATALEAGYRRLWAGLRAISELADGMFAGYPRFAASAAERVTIGPGTASVHAKPAVTGPDDWFALVTRLRVVMEDPTQLLSGAVTDYASAELVAHANDPSAVIVPGLDGEPYPRTGTR